LSLLTQHKYRCSNCQEVNKSCRLHGMTLPDCSALVWVCTPLRHSLIRLTMAVQQSFAPVYDINDITYDHHSHGRQGHWNIGGSQVECRRRENRDAVGGEGMRSGQGRNFGLKSGGGQNLSHFPTPPFPSLLSRGSWTGVRGYYPRKIFEIQYAIWYILVHFGEKLGALQFPLS